MWNVWSSRTVANLQETKRHMLSLAFCLYPLTMMSLKNQSRKKYCKYRQILQARRLFSNKCSQVSNHDLRMKFLKSLGLCSSKLLREYSSRMKPELRSNFSFSPTKETPYLHFKSTSRHVWIKNKVHLPQTMSLQVYACYKTYLSF